MLCVFVNLSICLCAYIHVYVFTYLPTFRKIIGQCPEFLKYPIIFVSQKLSEVYCLLSFFNTFLVLVEIIIKKRKLFMKSFFDYLFPLLKDFDVFKTQTSVRILGSLLFYTSPWFVNQLSYDLTNDVIFRVKLFKIRFYFFLTQNKYILKSHTISLNIF